MTLTGEESWHFLPKTRVQRGNTETLSESLESLEDGLSLSALPHHTLEVVWNLQNLS